GALEYAPFDPLYKRSDEALAQAAGIRDFGFRQMVEAQVRLLLALVPDRARVDPGRMAEAFHAPARAVVERNRPVLERVGRRYRLGVASNLDRQSTRLNSSHEWVSYAVFCLRNKRLKS